MSATVIGEKRQTTLPVEIVEAAGLKVNDRVEWRFEEGEIRGRKIVQHAGPRRIAGRLMNKGDALIFEIPKGYRLDPDAIARAVQEERESRS